MNIVLAVLLFAIANGGAGGRLFIQISPGFEVIVDGASAGSSNAADGGALIPNLAAGSHRVVVRSSDGREGSFVVSIADGQITTIQVSPLGLRKRLASSPADDLSVVNVNCVPEDCSAQLHGTKTNATDGEISFPAVPAGRYPIVVTRGTSSLHLDLDVATATILTVRADFNAGKIQVADTRPRPRRVQIAEANDALTPLAIPPYWKSAIRGVLPSGVTVTAANLAGENGVKVTLRVPSAEVGWSLIESLVSSTAFTRVTAPTAPRREQNGVVVVDFSFYFPPIH